VGRTLFSGDHPATILLAGFGRAAGEVGAVIIVGGNIDGYTRLMTTSIALETSKGNLPLAPSLSASS
jgi:tungstate transport system permease protein